MGWDGTPMKIYFIPWNGISIKKNFVSSHGIGWVRKSYVPWDSWDGMGQDHPIPRKALVHCVGNVSKANYA